MAKESQTVTRKLRTEEIILVSAATITSELSEVHRIAREMSLGVMNAKAISHRAGDAARGFQPITDFIDEMAREVTLLVRRIGEEALTLSRLAVARSHVEDTRERYTRVQQAAAQLSNVASLKPVAARLREESRDYRQRFTQSLRTLGSLLDDIRRSTRGAQVISSTSRVEASRAEGFTDTLEVVADNLEKATDKIRSRVNDCQNRLNDIRYVLANEDDK